MIAALQSDRGIGYQGNLIHSIKDDMQHFVEQTTGHTVIMGRKNWESIPEKYRPLKNRENIIITRDQNYHADGSIVVSNMEQAIQQSSSNNVYIIGGGQIYTLGLKYADMLDLTIVHDQRSADIFFPEYKNNFHQISGSGIMHDKKTDIDYEFQVWRRKNKVI